MGAVEHLAFGPLTVTFDDRVLRPRPWTLGQAAWAAELSKRLPDGPILELAAGAGHIGLAAAVLSDRRLVQVDINAAACTWARVNARVAGRQQRTEVRCGSFAEVLDAAERFPVVIADPPYVPTAEIDRFPEDPPVAIDGGPDGLDLPRACLAVAAAHVTPDGVVLLQTRGEAQAQAALAGNPSLALVEVRSWGPDRAVALAHPVAVPSASARSGDGCATMQS